MAAMQQLGSVAAGLGAQASATLQKFTGSLVARLRRYFLSVIAEMPLI